MSNDDAPRPKLHEIPGVRLKIRTSGETVHATLWVDDEPAGELASLSLSLVSDPEQEEYHQWIDALNALFASWVERAFGLDGIVGKRCAPQDSPAGEGWACHECGCSYSTPCDPPCHWVAPFLCSRCAPGA